LKIIGKYYSLIVCFKAAFNWLDFIKIGALFLCYILINKFSSKIIIPSKKQLLNNYISVVDVFGAEVFLDSN